MGNSKDRRDAEPGPDREGCKNRLGEALQQLRLLEELAHVGFWRVDARTEEIYWSDKVFSITGRSPETYQPTLTGGIDLYHPDDRDFVQRSVRRAVENAAPFDFEARLLRADGEERRVVVKGRAERDEDGQVLSVVGIFQDVTEQRKADLERWRSLERLRVHMEHTPLGVIEWDTEFRVVEWNARCEEIFGFKREEIVGRKGIDILVPEDSLSRALEIREELLTRQGGTHVVGSSLTKDRRRILCDWHNTPLFDERGEVNGVASICQDITERLRLEAQVAQYQKMEALGTLAGGVAHDMNNVLAVVMGLGSVVADTLPATDPRKDDMQELLSAAERGRSMVKSLLDFARQGERAKYRWSPGIALERLAQLLKKTVPKAIQVYTDLAPDLDDVMADSDQLATALMNLCINASQAIVGTGTITVAARNVELGVPGVRGPAKLPPGPYVCIRIIDDGAGMDDVTLARACEPFFTTKAMGQGTGLGLSMAYSTVEAHGGRVVLESALGEGTTVSLYLPAAESAAPTSESAAAPAQDTIGETLLVIDDEPMILRSTKRMLETCGYRVFCAEGGVDGLRVFAAHAHEIDAVLLDLSMPRMDGLECMKNIHAIEASVPVVICTGHGGPRHTERLTQSEAAAVLPKPFGRAALLQVLAEVLGRSGDDGGRP